MHYVTVGGGLASQRAVEVLREYDPGGQITMVSAETDLPYDRPPLSKEILRRERRFEDIVYRDADWYDANKVELLLGTRATGLDPRDRSIFLSDGRRLPYDRLLCATGSRPRRLNVPGEDLRGVFYLRSSADAHSLLRWLQYTDRVVVVGAGFIGGEVAASCKARGMHTAIVEALPLPLLKAVGQDVGRFLVALHRGHGTDVRLSTRVVKFGGSERVEAVITDSGEVLPCDGVVVGVGVIPEVEWLTGSGVEEDDGILVNERCMTTVQDVYAAGDVARWPYRYSGELVRLEHWDNASVQGATAAKNMVGLSSVQYGVPYFWSDQYDVRLQYFGYAQRADEYAFRGEAAARSFTCFYITDERIRAAAVVNRPREAMIVRRLIKSQRFIDSRALSDDGIDLRSLL